MTCRARKVDAQVAALNNAEYFDSSVASLGDVPPAWMWPGPRSLLACSRTLLGGDVFLVAVTLPYSMLIAPPLPARVRKCRWPMSGQRQFRSQRSSPLIAIVPALYSGRISTLFGRQPPVRLSRFPQ